MMKQNIVVFYGEDTFYIKNKLRQRIQAEGIDAFNVTTYDLEEILLSEALNDALTIPFMSEKKAVICNNAHFLGQHTLKKLLNHNLDQLQKYLSDPILETVLVLIVPHAQLNMRLAIVKQLKQHAEIIECKLKSGHDLKQWMKSQINKAGMTIEQEALDELFKRVQHSTEFAYQELRKLVMYTDDQRHINVSMIEKVITKNIEDNVYEITNAMLSKDHKRALDIYRDLILYSEDPLRILGIIIRKYREILQTQILLDQEADPQTIQTHFKVSSGRAYFMTQNAKAISRVHVEEHLIHLEKLDYHIKTGRIDKKMALELFILSV